MLGDSSNNFQIRETDGKFHFLLSAKIMADRKEVIKMTKKKKPCLEMQKTKDKNAVILTFNMPSTRFVFLYLTQPADVQLPRNANIFNRCKAIWAISLRERLQLWFLVTLRIGSRGLRTDSAMPPLPAWGSVLQNDSISGCGGKLL